MKGSVMQALEGTFAGVFSGVPEQIIKVCGQVRDFLDGCPAADDVVLIVSELAASVTIYSPPGNKVFAVRAKRYDTCVYLEVEDADSPWIPAFQDDCPHGLDIVGTLARQWGVKEFPRRIVWATVDF
jgi:hypothetical protein